MRERRLIFHPSIQTGGLWSFQVILSDFLSPPCNTNFYANVLIHDDGSAALLADAIETSSTLIKEEEEEEDEEEASIVKATRWLWGWAGILSDKAQKRLSMRWLHFYERQ